MPVVNREVVLPCDRERAWELITEPDELAEWYGEELDEIEELTEGERIVFRSGESRVEWRLEDAVSGTRFLVTEHRITHDAITWGPKLMALSAASALCLA
jgi:uncharacterized protein YndB with AHSA1/START domain